MSSGSVSRDVIWKCITWCHLEVYHVMSSGSVSRDVIWKCIAWCHLEVYHVMSSGSVSRDVIWKCITWCHLEVYHVMSSGSVSRDVICDWKCVTCTMLATTIEYTSVQECHWKCVTCTMLATTIEYTSVQECTRFLQCILDHDKDIFSDDHQSTEILTFYLIKNYEIIWILYITNQATTPLIIIFRDISHIQWRTFCCHWNHGTERTEKWTNFLAGSVFCARWISLGGHPRHVLVSEIFHLPLDWWKICDQPQNNSSGKWNNVICFFWYDLQIFRSNLSIWNGIFLSPGLIFQGSFLKMRGIWLSARMWMHAPHRRRGISHNTTPLYGYSWLLGFRFFWLTQWVTQILHSCSVREHYIRFMIYSYGISQVWWCLVESYVVRSGSIYARYQYKCFNMLEYIYKCMINMFGIINCQIFIAKWRSEPNTRSWFKSFAFDFNNLLLILLF